MMIKLQLKTIHFVIIKDNKECTIRRIFKSTTPPLIGGSFPLFFIVQLLAFSSYYVFEFVL